MSFRAARLKLSAAVFAMTEPMVAKRLAFEDLSVTLSSLVDGGAAADIKVKLAELVRCVHAELATTAHSLVT